MMLSTQRNIPPKALKNSTAPIRNFKTLLFSSPEPILKNSKKSSQKLSVHTEFTNFVSTETVKYKMSSSMITSLSLTRCPCSRAQSEVNKLTQCSSKKLLQNFMETTNLYQPTAKHSCKQSFVELLERKIFHVLKHVYRSSQS